MFVICILMIFDWFFSQYGVQGQCPAYAPNIVEKQGSRLYGHVITWLYAEKEILCRLKCNMIEKCLTINYNSANEICELNDGDDLKDLRPSQGFVYIDMKKKKKSNKEHGTNIAPTASRPGTLASASTTPAISSTTPTPPSTTQVPRYDVFGHSCKEIKDLGKSHGDGEYWIDPNRTGQPFTVYCDMTTDSGGWTLIKRSILKSIKNINQQRKINKDNYSAISNYHDIGQNVRTTAIQKLREDMGFHQIRFRCRKKRVNRTIHIMTTNNTAGHKVLDHFLVKPSWPTACNSFKRLPDDTSILAQNCEKWGCNDGEIEVNQWGNSTNRGRSRIYNNVIVWKNKHYLGFSVRGPYYCDDSNGNTVSVGDIWELYVR